jgi:hypothetical protein
VANPERRGLERALNPPVARPPGRPFSRSVSPNEKMRSRPSPLTLLAFPLLPLAPRLPASLLIPLARYRSSPIQAPPHAKPNAKGATAKANSTPSGATSARMATMDARASAAASAGSSTPIAELARATK